jgi:signal peptidase II
LDPLEPASEPELRVVTSRFASVSQSPKKWIAFGVAVAVVLALDILSKSLAEAHLPLGEYREVLPFLGLERTMNTGVAFGLLAGRPVLILVARGLALTVVLAYLFIETRPLLSGIAAGLLVGGSVGNIVDQIGRGYVTDFLKLPWWPNFNVADVFIVAGVGLLLVSLVLTWRKAEESARTESSSDPPSEDTTA